MAKLPRLKLPFDLIEEKRSIALILCVLLGGNLLVYAFVALPLRDRVVALTSALRDYDREDRHLQQSWENIQVLDARIGSHQETLTRFQEEILGDKTVKMRPILKGIRSFAQRNRMIIENISYAHNLEEGINLVAFAIRFSLEGSYEDLKGFIQDIENAEHFLIIESISIRKHAGGRRAASEQTSKLSLNIGIITYFQPEPPPQKEVEQLSNLGLPLSERRDA